MNASDSFNLFKRLRWKIQILVNEYQSVSAYLIIPGRKYYSATGKENYPRGRSYG
jgi:hypothetical protein